MTERRDDSELPPIERTYTTPPLENPPVTPAPRRAPERNRSNPIDTARERLAEGYATASETVREAARAGRLRAQAASERVRLEALRARAEVSRRMDEDPVQVIAYSAAIGFLTGLTLRIISSRSHEDDGWTELP